MRIGYGRVSTLDQNLDSQHDALQAAGCDRIFVDKATGKDTDRPEFQKALSTARSGDQFVATDITRVSRSVADLIAISNKLRDDGVDLVLLNDNIDTTTPIGEFYFVVMAAVAQLVRRQIQTKTLEGLAAARKRGRIGGRKPAMSRAQVRAAIEYYEKSDATWEQVAAEFKVPLRTLHSSRRREATREAS